MSKKPIYRIFFNSQGKSYEIYARTVCQAEMYGFVAVEGLLFGERSAVLVDPAEEGLKNEFQDVNRLLIPLQHIVRIDEVSKQGRGKIVTMAQTEQSSAAPAMLPPQPPAKKGS